MKAITVRDPWAQAIIYGGKRIENRSYRWRDAPGWIAIHCGKTRDDENFEPYRSLYVPSEDLHRPGHIIGFAHVTECVDATEKQARSPWAQGPVYWVIDLVFALDEPIEARGMPGLFEIDFEIADLGSWVECWYQDGPEFVQAWELPNRAYALKGKE